MNWFTFRLPDHCEIGIQQMQMLSMIIIITAKCTAYSSTLFRDCFERASQPSTQTMVENPYQFLDATIFS